MQIQTEGIVLRATKYAEADLILNVMTKKFGKIGIYAKNARRLKSPLMSSGQIFSHSDMIVSTFDGKYRMKSAELINNHFAISQTFEKTCVGYYYLQFTEKISIEEQTNIRLFELLKTMLNVLQKENNYLLQKVIFDLKIIDIFGYKPNIEHCVHCSRKDHLGNYFGIYEGGRICLFCKSENRDLIRLDSTSFRLINYILGCNIENVEKIFEAKISRSILLELNLMLEKYIDYHFDNVDLPTRKMLIL